MAATPVFIRWHTRLDAWKLSCGKILSISACNFERGKILLSALIFSTAYLNAISCGSVASSPPLMGSEENNPPGINLNKLFKTPMDDYCVFNLMQHVTKGSIFNLNKFSIPLNFN